MAGTQVLTNIQLAKETVFGTAVARTRKFYGVTTGAYDFGYEWATRDNENRGVKTKGTAPALIRTAPKFRLQDVDGIGYDDLVLPFSIGLEGGQTGTGGSADKTWQFTAQNATTAAYESMCMDVGDDVQNYTIAGVIAQAWTISAVAGEPTHFTMDLVGSTNTKGAKTTVANVTPIQIPGGLWTLKHASAFADLAAASVQSNFIRSFELTWNPGRVPQYYLNGSLSMGTASESYLEGTLSMVVDSTAYAVSEYYDKWVASTMDFCRLKVTSTEVLGGSFYSLGFDMPLYYTNVQAISGETDGINQYAIEAKIVYDATATKSLEANLVCSLSAIP